MSLKDKRIVILGGSSGIGFSTAKAAAEEGALVVIGSSRKDKIEQALSRLPPGCMGETVDLTDEPQVERLFHRIGAFDHLAFTAGESLKLGELSETNLKEARQFFELRYWGALAAVKYGVSLIRQGGSITLSSGIAGHRPRKGWTLAASVCGAAEGLARALAVELAPIRVNIVCPGLVKTELWDGMPEAERVTMYQRAGQLLPVGRAGEAADLAQSYLYSMRCGFSTGQVIIADGGAVVG
jgi:NAD(P)-dependent dehydrogenase (short-subunit alcohol dehydrogenase family)